MNTTIYKSIASTTFFLRLLNNVTVDRENRTCTYTKQGVTQTISGEKYERLSSLVNMNKHIRPDYRMAMCMRNNHTNGHYIVIARTFYDEF